MYLSWILLNLSIPTNILCKNVGITIRTLFPKKNLSLDDMRINNRIHNSNVKLSTGQKVNFITVINNTSSYSRYTLIIKNIYDPTWHIKIEIDINSNRIDNERQVRYGNTISSFINVGRLILDAKGNIVNDSIEQISRKSEQQFLRPSWFQHSISIYVVLYFFFILWFPVSCFLYPTCWLLLMWRWVIFNLLFVFFCQAHVSTTYVNTGNTNCWKPCDIESPCLILLCILISKYVHIGLQCLLLPCILSVEAQYI